MKYVQAAFETNWLSTVGANLDALEARFNEFCHSHSVALCSGTAAIHLGLKLLGVREGDEVLCPTLTFVASANPILYERATPVFIDSERRSWNLDPNLLEEFLKNRARGNRLPRAIIVVHLFGQCADLGSILSICKRYDVPVLEDAAEALGARYQERPVGTFGEIGIYSFNGNKVITSSGGGMLVSSNPAFVEKARFWSSQACDPGRDYLHSEVGYNYRLSNVLAGIALGQLESLEERVEARRRIARTYRDAFLDLPGIEFMPEPPDAYSTNWLSCILIDSARFGRSQSELLEILDRANISARPVWRPMHLQKLYAKYECIGGAAAQDLNVRGICLPSSSSLTGEEQQFVIRAIREAQVRTS